MIRRGVRPIFIIALLGAISLAAVCLADVCSTPLVPHSDQADEREFQNVYQCIPDLSAWTAFSPSFTNSIGGFSIGNGFSTGAYSRIGHDMEIITTLYGMSTTNFGNSVGIILFSLPGNYKMDSTLSGCYGDRSVYGDAEIFTMGGVGLLVQPGIVSSRDCSSQFEAIISTMGIVTAGYPFFASSAPNQTLSLKFSVPIKGW